MRVGTVLAAVLVMATLAASAGAQASPPTQLVLSQGDAFAVLGYWCGGISEKVYATGYAPQGGAPQGYAFLSTTCNGSGRGGHSHTYTAWAQATWDFAGNVLSYAAAPTVPVLNPTLSLTDRHGDHLYNQNNQAYVTSLPLAAPTAVTATLYGGPYKVTWSRDPTARAALITSSLITATPVSGQTITAAVNGSASSGLLGPLEPHTQYAITVMSSDPAGWSPASAPLTITTGASTIPPGAPTGVTACWTAPLQPGDQLVASWHAGRVGDSPTDGYQVNVNNGDGTSRTQSVSASTFTAAFGSIDDTTEWTVKVRAHDAAGWGAWSTGFLLGGN